MEKKGNSKILIMQKLIILSILLMFHYSLNAQYKSEEIKSMIKNSVVSIKNSSGTGSGVVIGQDGIIITNYHVYNGKKMTVIDQDNKSYEEDKIILINKERDFAVFKIKNSSLPAIKFGNNDFLKEGEQVYAMGSPRRLDGTISQGLFSRKRNLKLKDDISAKNYLQHDAKIYFGSSGGALVNNKGELIGINVAIDLYRLDSITELNPNVGWSIPFNEIWEEIKDFDGIAKIPLTNDNSVKDSFVPNKDCEENNVGDYCFTNNTNVKLSVTIRGAGIKQLTLEPSQKQCFYNLMVRSWKYSYIEPKAGGYQSKSSKYGAGEIFVEKCKTGALIIR
ncbi:MAG TPA: trypsin-like peptidase domain-containing protein [Bacteroidia bacterium]|nr:trypsin-like peptidase domain-containing protein [Bacteroidia bacterium]